MDWLTFVARIIEALAWPLVVLVLLIALRGEFKSLVPLLRKLKAGPLEAEFEKAVQEVSKEADIDVAAATYVPAAPEDKLYTLARINPRSAILEAWMKVEAIAKRAAIHNGGSPTPDVSTGLKAIRELTKQSLLNPDDIALFHDLRGLRNQAAHLETFDVTENSAIEFILLAAKLRENLERLSSPNS